MYCKKKGKFVLFGFLPTDASDDVVDARSLSEQSNRNSKLSLELTEPSHFQLVAAKFNVDSVKERPVRAMEGSSSPADGSTNKYVQSMSNYLHGNEAMALNGLQGVAESLTQSPADLATSSNFRRTSPRSQPSLLQASDSGAGLLGKRKGDVLLNEKNKSPKSR